MKFKAIKLLIFASACSLGSITLADNPIKPPVPGCHSQIQTHLGPYPQPDSCPCTSDGKAVDGFCFGAPTQFSHFLCVLTPVQYHFTTRVPEPSSQVCVYCQDTDNVAYYNEASQGGDCQP